MGGSSCPVSLVFGPEGTAKIKDSTGNKVFQISAEGWYSSSHYLELDCLKSRRLKLKFLSTSWNHFKTQKLEPYSFTISTFPRLSSFFFSSSHCLSMQDNLKKEKKKILIREMWIRWHAVPVPRTGVVQNLLGSFWQSLKSTLLNLNSIISLKQFPVSSPNTQEREKLAWFCLNLTLSWNQDTAKDG